MAKKKVLPESMEVPKMTSQEVFNKVTTHLIGQGVPSEHPVTLTGRYRTETGKKCAVGCLIPEQVYDPKMERCGGELEKLSAFPGMGNLKEHIPLLKSLQILHDRDRSTSFTDKKPTMRLIARQFDLTIPDNIAK